MLDDTADVLHLPQRRNVRLDTLLRLRWLAILGQTTAVLVVYYAVEFPLPMGLGDRSMTAVREARSSRS